MLTEDHKFWCRFHENCVGKNILSEQLKEERLGSSTFTRRTRLWDYFLTENSKKIEDGATDGRIKEAHLVIGGSGSGKTSYVRNALSDAREDRNVIVDDHPTRTLLKDIIPRLQEQGIQTNIHYVAAPMIDAFTRNAMRREQGVKMGYSPAGFLRSHDTQQEAFSIGYQSSLEDPSLFRCRVVLNPLSEEERNLKQYEGNEKVVLSKYMSDIPPNDAYSAVSTLGRRAFSNDQQYQAFLNAMPEARGDEPTHDQPIPSTQAAIVQPAPEPSGQPKMPGSISGPHTATEGSPQPQYYTFSDTAGNEVSVWAHNLLPVFHGEKNTEVTAQTIEGPYINDFNTPCYSHAGVEVSADNTKLAAVLEEAALQQRAASAPQHTQDPEQVRDDQPETLLSSSPYGQPRSSQAYDNFTTDLSQALQPVSSDPYGHRRIEYPQTAYQPEAVEQAQPAASQTVSPATAAASPSQAQGGASSELRRSSRSKAFKPKALEKFEKIKNIFKRRQER